MYTACGRVPVVAGLVEQDGAVAGMIARNGVRGAFLGLLVQEPAAHHAVEIGDVQVFGHAGGAGNRPSFLEPMRGDLLDDSHRGGRTFEERFPRYPRRGRPFQIVRLDVANDDLLVHLAPVRADLLGRAGQPDHGNLGGSGWRNRHDTGDQQGRVSDHVTLHVVLLLMLGCYKST